VPLALFSSKIICAPLGANVRNFDREDTKKQRVDVEVFFLSVFATLRFTVKIHHERSLSHSGFCDFNTNIYDVLSTSEAGGKKSFPNFDQYKSD
jgi:hypothetical protein